MDTKRAVTGQSSIEIVSHGIPLACRTRRSLAFQSGISGRPTRPSGSPGQNGNGHCVECSDGVQLRVPEMLRAVDLEDEVPNGDRTYVRLNRVGGSKISGKISAV